MASGVSVGDARILAPDMRTTPDTILSQPKLQFATYVRGVTPHAIPLPVTPGLLQQEPQMDDEIFDRFVELNRERVAEVLSHDEQRNNDVDGDGPNNNADLDMVEGTSQTKPSTGDDDDDPDDPTKPGQW